MSKLGQFMQRLARVAGRLKPFPGSHDYWIRRYERGGDSVRAEALASNY